MERVTTAGEILAGIRNADFHEGGIRALRLFAVDAAAFARMRAEIGRYAATRRPSEVAAPEHVTHWTRPVGDVLQFSLFNRSGRSDDFASDHDLSSAGKFFGDPDLLPVTAALVAALPDCCNVRVNVLGPGAQLSAHEEHVTFRTRSGSIGLRVRFHLPIETTPAAELWLDGEAHHLEAGSIYFVNNGCVHAALNRSDDAPRAHVVWDMLLTRAAFDTMFGDGPAPLDWLRRIEPERRALRPLRSERVVTYRRLAPSVPRWDAERVAFCEPQ